MLSLEFLTADCTFLCAEACRGDAPQPIVVRAGGGSVTGSRRTNNEDAYYADPAGPIFVVADGIGGAPAGELASRMAVDLLVQSLRLVPEEASDEEVVQSVRQAFVHAHTAIAARGRTDIQCYRMGTTAVVARLAGQPLFVVGVGDSRAYLIRDGRINQLTVDDSLAQALADKQKRSSAEELRHSLPNILWRYLGADEFGNGPDVRTIRLQANDRVLLATDGLTEVLDASCLLRIVEQSADPTEAAERLIAAAQDGGARDDITCVALFAAPIDSASAVAVH